MPPPNALLYQILPSKFVPISSCRSPRPRPVFWSCHLHFGASISVEPVEFVSALTQFYRHPTLHTQSPFFGSVLTYTSVTQKSCLCLSLPISFSLFLSIYSALSPSLPPSKLPFIYPSSFIPFSSTHRTYYVYLSFLFCLPSHVLFVHIFLFLVPLVLFISPLTTTYITTTTNYTSSVIFFPSSFLPPPKTQKTCFTHGFVKFISLIRRRKTTPQTNTKTTPLCPHKLHPQPNPSRLTHPLLMLLIPFSLHGTPPTTILISCHNHPRLHFKLRPSPQPAFICNTRFPVYPPATLSSS